MRSRLSRMAAKLLVTVRAKAVEKEFVTGGPETSRQFGPERSNTSLEFVKFFAVIALKVMMVCLARHFVTGRRAWNFDLFEPAILYQQLDISVNGCLAEIRMMALRTGENFIWRERPAGFKKGIADGCFLPGLNALLHNN